jgi:sigma-E factor negative regulatory protein RseA
MTEQKHEQLSALVDGELGADETRALLNELESDPEIRGHWERYHLIGEALRGALPEQMDTGLAARVSAALEDEPALLAPANLRLGRLNPYLKQAAGMAIAAGVAVAAVLVVPVLVREEPAVAPSQQIASAPVESPAGIMRTELSPAERSRTLVDERLQDYLVNHYEHSAITRVQGVLPYVRIVGSGEKR